MTSVIDPNAIGKPAAKRRHVRTLTGKTHPALNALLSLDKSRFRLSTRGGREWQGEMAKG